MATCAEAGAGSRELAIRAARSAIDGAGRRPEEIELLINAGVYRDENIVEPAMGPFIQRGLTDGSPPPDGAGTFSFDISNGVCGLVTAMSVIGGFIGSGRVRCGMAVASDTDPAPGSSENYPFAAAGGAVLLGRSSGREGFAWFHSRTWNEHFSLYEARLCGTDDIPDPTATGSARDQRLRISARSEYLERCLDCARLTVSDAVDRGQLDLARVDLVIAAPAGDFGEALAEGLGLDRRVVPSLAGAPRGVHTASTAFALDAALRDGSWARARRVLFVAAGAGVTVSLALYEREPGAGPGPAG